MTVHLPLLTCGCILDQWGCLLLILGCHLSRTDSSRCMHRKHRRRLLLPRRDNGSRKRRLREQQQTSQRVPRCIRPSTESHTLACRHQPVASSCCSTCEQHAQLLPTRSSLHPHLPLDCVQPEHGPTCVLAWTLMVPIPTMTTLEAAMSFS